MTMPSPVPWLDPLLIAWFAMTAISVVYVAWDAFTRKPEFKVMKWGWILVTLYGGPIVAAAYVLSCPMKSFLSPHQSGRDRVKSGTPTSYTDYDMSGTALSAGIFRAGAIARPSRRSASRGR